MKNSLKDLHNWCEQPGRKWKKDEDRKTEIIWFDEHKENKWTELMNLGDVTKPTDINEKRKQGKGIFKE
jgi:hypothetical protein